MSQESPASKEGRKGFKSGVAEAIGPTANEAKSSKARRKAGNTTKKKKPLPPPKKPSNREPADEVLLLIKDLDPATQGLLHRFSLRLQAQIARQAISWLAGYGLVMTVVVVIMSFMIATNVKIVGLDANGKMVDSRTIDNGQLKYTDAVVSNFASESITELFDFNFTNFGRVLETVTQKRFTDYGRTQLQAAIQPLLTDVRELQGIVFSESGGPAMVIKRNRERTRFTVQKEVLVTLKPGDDKPITNRQTVTLIINRVDDYSGMKGLAINQIVMKRAKQ